jgi:hypothetical protein
MDPALATRLGKGAAERLRPLLGAKAPRAVVAPRSAACSVAHEVARGLSCLGLFTERQDGKMALGAASRSSRATKWSWSRT